MKGSKRRYVSWHLSERQGYDILRSAPNRCATAAGRRSRRACNTACRRLAGDFNLTMRFYGPLPAVLNGSYRLTAVKRLQ